MSNRYSALIDKYVGGKIKHFRQAVGISQSDFSAQTQVSLADLSSYETGEKRASAETLLRIATILNIEVTDLFQGIDGNALRMLDE